MQKGFTLVQTDEQFEFAIQAITGAAEIVLDTETTGLDLWGADRQCGVGIYMKSIDKGWYFPFRHTEQELPLFSQVVSSSGRALTLPWRNSSSKNLSVAQLENLFQALRSVKKIIGHNIKFDLAALYQDGFEIGDDQELEDTITGARMYFADKYAPLDLDSVCAALLDDVDLYWKKDFRAFLKKNKWHKNYDQAPPEMVGDYCLKDCKFTSRIHEILTQHIRDTGQLRVWNQESALLKILWKMEKEGLFFDRAYCEDRLKKLHDKLFQLEQQIYALVGMEFDIRSPKQLNEVMLKLGIQSPHLTPTGKPKWGVAELLAADHPIGGLILEYRGIEKMRSTYFEPLLAFYDNRQHPSFKPWGAVTGRMSCVSPSLMNLSNKTQDLAGEEESEEAAEAIKAMMGARAGQKIDMTSSTGKGRVGGASFASLTSYAKKYEDNDTSVSVRRLYVAPPGFILYCLDYSQMEMRIFADYVKDKSLNNLLDDPDFDFHSHVAREVWKVDESSPLWKFYRTLAKAINFGLLYGIGNEKLSAQIQKSVEEAIVYKRDYFARFPKAYEFMKLVKKRIDERGYVVNRFGRRYTVPADKSYVGVNYLIQGGGADIMKSRMLVIDEFLKDKESRLVVQIHDELVFYIKEEEENEVVPKLKEIMEERVIETYLPVDVSRCTPSWAVKTKMCVKCMNPKEGCKC